MNKLSLAAVAALVSLQGQALAADDALLASLNDANTRALAYNLNAESSLKISAQTQFQYNINLRDDDTLGDDDTTIGFQMRRTRVNIENQVTDSIKAKIQFEFAREGGDGEMLEAYADWTVNDSLKLRIGQQKVHFWRETTLGSTKQLTAEESVTSSVFTQGYAQMVEAAFGGDSWRGWVSFSDGFDSRNTSFDSSSEADYALTGRAEFKFGDADWKQFDQYTSWRGAASGGMVGVAAHWQTAGDTNPSSSSSTDTFSVTADFSWVADGWNAAIAGVWRSVDDGSTDQDDYGILAQAGVFLSDQFELFGRYDVVLTDDDLSADDFSTVTGGFNYYITPESHAAKFTMQVAYYLDAVDLTGGVVSPSDGLHLLADGEDGQIALTTQLQLLF